MPLHHKNLNEEQKQWTPEMLKACPYRPYSKIEAQHRREQGLPITIPCFDVIYEGTFERGKPGWWTGYDWDEVRHCHH